MRSYTSMNNRAESKGLSNFVVRHRSLTSPTLPPLPKFKVPSSGWCQGSSAPLDWRGWRERERERGTEGGGGRRIIFYHSPLFLPPPSNHLSDGGLYLAERRPIRRDTLQPPSSRCPSNAKSFPPLLGRGGGGGWGVEGDAIALHWVRVITPSKASRWPRRQRPESIRAPPPAVSAVSDTGVQCTVRFSTFIIRGGWYRSWLYRGLKFCFPQDSSRRNSCIIREIRLKKGYDGHVLK